MPASPTGTADVSTVLYLGAIFVAVYVVRLFSTPSTYPKSLVRGEEDTLSLYAWTGGLILFAYLPAASSLVRRGGGSATLLVASVFATLAANVPLGATFRTFGDESRAVRDVLGVIGLSLWIVSLANDTNARIFAVIFALSIATVRVVMPLAINTQILLEVAIFVTLHLKLAHGVRIDARPHVWAWRSLAAVLFAPTFAICAVVLVSTGGHALFGMHDLVGNHAGFPMCPLKHTEILPETVKELQLAVISNEHVRPAGGGHSWSSLACPQEYGVLLRMDLIREQFYHVDTQELEVGAGVTFGTVQNVLHSKNRMLSSNWHTGVTVGGAIATAVQHIPATGISEIVSSVTILLANGSMHTTTPADDLFDYIFGSVGMLGVVVSARLRTVARAEVSWTSRMGTWANDRELRALVHSWSLGNSSSSSVLWLLPTLREYTLQTASTGAPLQPPLGSATALRPHLRKYRFGDATLVYGLYANLLSLAVHLAEPLVRFVATNVANRAMQSFVKDYLNSEVANSHAPVDNVEDVDMNLLPTMLATAETCVSVSVDHAESCVSALSRFPYPVALHLRFAQRTVLPLANSGPGILHIDFSVSETLIPLLAPQLQLANDACPTPTRDGHIVAVAHAGKLSLADLEKRRVWRAPDRATLPGAGPGSAHAVFRDLLGRYDPIGKFLPF